MHGKEQQKNCHAFRICEFFFNDCHASRHFLLLNAYFFQLGLTPCKTDEPLKGMEVQEKEAKKIKAYRKSIVSVNSKLKATKIIGQRKAFYGQRIPQLRCARKETVDINILVTSRNGDRKIIQSIRITSRPPLRKRKWNQLSQF